MESKKCWRSNWFYTIQLCGADRIFCGVISVCITSVESYLHILILSSHIRMYYVCGVISVCVTSVESYPYVLLLRNQIRMYYIWWHHIRMYYFCVATNTGAWRLVLAINFNVFNNSQFLYKWGSGGGSRQSETDVVFSGQIVAHASMFHAYIGRKYDSIFY